MKQKADYRTKLRAVFLAAIMVTSVVGMSVAFAGSAAAVAPITVNDFDDRGQFPSVVEEGQEFRINTDNAISNNDDPSATLDFDDGVAYILEVEDRGENDYSTIRDIDIDNNGHFVLDTAGLTERYVIANESASNADDSTTSDRSFEVRERPLTVEWDEDEVTEDDDNVAFELDTDRRLSTMNVTIWAEGPDDLEHADLAALFNVSGSDLVQDEAFLPLDAFDGFDRGDDPSDFEDEGYLTIDLSNLDDTQLDGDDLIANFTKLDEDADFPDPGEYEFNVYVTDTGQEASDSITIREDDQDVDFSQGVYTQTAGDIAEFSLELEDTDEVYIQIGDEDVGFVDVLYIEADERGADIEFRVNTRTLGSNESTDHVYDAGDGIDNLYSAVHDNSTTFEAQAGADIFVDDDGDSVGNFSNYLDELGLIDDDILATGDADRAGQSQLTRPLQPADYELTAAAIDDGAVFVVDDGESEAEDELDNAVLDLVAPGLGSVTTWVAPSDDADEDDEIADLLEVVTERTDIALDDRLIVQFEASGLYGNMVNQSAEGFDMLEDGTAGDTIAQVADTDDMISLSIESDNVIGNQEPVAVDFDGATKEEILVLVDNEAGEFFVVIDTSADVFSNGEPEDGDTFDIEFEYDTDEDDRPRYNTDSNGLITSTDAFDLETPGFPYFTADTTETVTAEITFEDRDVSFDNLNADDEIQAENVENSEISGVTNVAPGSNAEVRVSSTDASSSFRMGQDIDINEDGDFSIEFYFSGQEVGDEFDTRFRVSGSNVDTVDSVIVEEGDLGVADPEDDEDDVIDDDDDAVDDEDDVIDDDDDAVDDDDDTVDDETDDETPGFGALVALVALIGAALLAARRQNN